MKILTSTTETHLAEVDKEYSVSRRRFFQLTGGLTGAGIILTASTSKAGILNQSIGRGDTALLNMLYALQQIEAAFYTEAVEKQKETLHFTNLAALIHIRDQEVGHTIVLKKLLGVNAATAVSPDFSAVNFSDYANVVYHAAIIEEMSVAGFNSAAGMFSDTDNALAVTRPAMADAGHASLPSNLGIAKADDHAMPNDMDTVPTPATILAIAETYAHNRFDKSNLPNHINS